MTLAPRFSLRTFLLVVTVVAIVLAGVRYNERPKRIVSVAEMFAYSNLEHWPTSQANRTDPDTQSQRREASSLVANHLAGYLLKQGYSIDPVPDDLERWLPRQLPDADSQDQFLADESYHYFLQQTSGSEKVYALLVRRDGRLAYLRTGIRCKQPSGPNYANALDPAVLAERDQVVNLFKHLDKLARGCHDLEQLKEGLTRLKNQQAAAP